MWWHRKKKKDSGGQSAQAAPAIEEDIGLAFRQADARIRTTKLGEGARVGNLPLFLLVGEVGSGKTSVVLHSGLEPELIAGQVFQNTDVIPTGNVNLWFARAVFAEAGGKLQADPAKWTRLVRTLRPRRTIVGHGRQAPRAALVCYDCANFLQPNSQEAAANAARVLRGRLSELSQALGIDIPVYVVFTKMDLLPFFTEYVARFSNDEAQQVFGAALPMTADPAAGVYAETETRRLSAEFDRLFGSLAERRTAMLARENDGTRLRAIYEFPREFRKIRPAAVQFLLDLCRPSQLTVGPFLRGFYFAGVRPVLMAENTSMVARMSPVEEQTPSRATEIFRRELPGASRQPPAVLEPAAGTRKVPQWTFLRQFFHEVLIPDQAAQHASSASVHTRTVRRVLLAAAAVLCLFLGVAFSISFLRNRALETGVEEARSALSSIAATGSDLAPVEALRSLEALRQSLEQLRSYQRNGPPWSYRWGLYTGDELYRYARTLYFADFRRLLLAAAQDVLVEHLRRLPVAPGPEYSPTYSVLKAYLITTSHHDKSTRAFLTPVLLRAWSNGRPVDPDRESLAQKQFDFYAGELKESNPFAADNDSVAIEQARRYLAQFAAGERVYAFMVAEAAKSSSPINFNRQFPGSAATVVETHEVGGAFSKAGWAFMKDALQHAGRYFNGEKWVLGEQTAAQIDPARLEHDLRARYYADFVREWRLYLKSAAVTSYVDVKDAAAKLGAITSNQSPLLALLSVASQNTAVDDAPIAAIFQPAQAVVPPNSTDRYIAPPNQGYINALTTLQASLEGATEQPGDVTPQVLNNALQAKVVTRQIAQNFRADGEGHIDAAVQQLLEEPITHLEQTLRGAMPAELNAGGRELCTQFRALTARFPFNPKSKAEATPGDIDAILRKPDGALWSYYEKSLKKALIRQGPRYVPSGATPLNPAFVTFFNTAAGISDALYPPGATGAAFTYTVKPGVSDGVQGITLRIDGQMFTYAPGDAASAKTFTWHAAGTHDLTANVHVGGAEFEWQHHSGIWGMFHFFAEAKQPAAQVLEWPVGAGGQQFKADGKPVTVRLEVDLDAMGAMFRNGGLNCVALVAQ